MALHIAMGIAILGVTMTGAILSVRWRNWLFPCGLGLGVLLIYVGVYLLVMQTHGVVL